MIGRHNIKCEKGRPAAVDSRCSGKGQLKEVASLGRKFLVTVARVCESFTYKSMQMPFGMTTWRDYGIIQCDTQL